MEFTAKMTLFYEFGACLNILFTQMLAAEMLIASDTGNAR